MHAAGGIGVTLFNAAFVLATLYCLFGGSVGSQTSVFRRGRRGRSTAHPAQLDVIIRCQLLLL